MGQALLPHLEAAADVQLVGKAELGDDLRAAIQEASAQVVVDFTQPESARSNAERILDAGANGVIGTTGFSAEDLEALDTRAQAAARGLLIAPNFALGMILLQRAAEAFAAHLPRAEVIEGHHEGKRDAPSGTARHTAARIARAGGSPGPHLDAPARGLDVDGVPVHSLRMPGLHAWQEVRLANDHESVVLRHEALDRSCYVPGVLLAIRRVSSFVGLRHGLEHVLP